MICHTLSWRDVSVCDRQQYVWWVCLSGFTCLSKWCFCVNCVLQCGHWCVMFSCTVCICAVKLLLLMNAKEFFQFMMHSVETSGQIFLGCKWFVTRAAEMFQFMIKPNMCGEPVFPVKQFVPQCTGERFQFLMNSINMLLQITFISKWFVTQWAGKLFPSWKPGVRRFLFLVW